MSLLLPGIRAAFTFVQAPASTEPARATCTPVSLYADVSLFALPQGTVSPTDATVYCFTHKTCDIASPVASDIKFTSLFAVSIAAETSSPSDVALPWSFQLRAPGSVGTRYEILQNWVSFALVETSLHSSKISRPLLALEKTRFAPSKSSVICRNLTRDITACAEPPRLSRVQPSLLGFFVGVLCTLRPPSAHTLCLILPSFSSLTPPSKQALTAAGLPW